MIRWILDTDTLSLYRGGHPQVVAEVESRPGDEIAVSVITVEEQLAGWYRLLPRARSAADLARTYERLADAVRFFQQVQIVSFTTMAIARYEQLRALKLNVGAYDLRIAATALTCNATVVTRNRRDFERVPGLRVEDWSA